MHLFSQDVQSLRALYILGLKKALDMERKVVHSLTHLAERATDPELSKAFLSHMDASRAHVEKVEGLLFRITGRTERVDSKAVDGLAVEISDTITDVTDATIRDMALIGVAQQVEHHEIAVYGTLRRWAVLLGFGWDGEILAAIEADEANVDATLTEISERIRFQAAA